MPARVSVGVSNDQRTNDSRLERVQREVESRKQSRYRRF
jgi:hypothetical protein